MFHILLLAAAATQVCPDAELDRPLPDAAIVIHVILERKDLPGTESLPRIGEAPESRMHVRARVVAVERGTFSINANTSIRLALHSIALTFGYDHVDEEYLVGLDSTEHVLWLAPKPDRLVRFKGTVIGVTERSASGALLLVERPEVFATVRVAAVENGAGTFRAGEELSVGLPRQLVARGKSYCFILLARAPSAARPFRLMRIVR